MKRGKKISEWVELPLEMLAFTDRDLVEILKKNLKSAEEKITQHKKREVEIKK